MSKIIQSLEDISSSYGAMFVDLWGCVHDGIRAMPDAVAALRAYRARGGVVALVTNSPRPRAGVETQIAGFGVPEDCWDAVTTSGDSARAAMFLGVIGRKVWFMGEEDRDSGFFEPLRILDDPVGISRVPLAEAEGIACCGPFDPMADPEDNRAAFEDAIARGLKLLCANPDIVVDRGDTREWCAGALAALYTRMGGESLYFGKPHKPIYDLARRRLAALGREFDDREILVVGDGIDTDIAGGLGEGLDTLFISGGLAAAETRTPRGGQPDPAALSRYLERVGREPRFTIGFLR